LQSYFKEGWSLIKRIEPKVHSSTQKIVARGSIIKSIRDQMMIQRSLVESGLDKDKLPTSLPNSKDGLLYKQNTIKEWLLRYFKVIGDTLYSFKKLRKGEINRYDFSQPKKFCSLFLCRVQAFKNDT
jgi:hypothetical protein